MARRAQAATDKKVKTLIETRMEKSDQKLDSMTVLMLHYCAGLQHCLDQEELQRVKQQEQEIRPSEDGEATCAIVSEHSSLAMACGSSSGVEDVGGPDVELTLMSATTTSTDRTGQTELEQNLQVELNSEVDMDTMEDVGIVSYNEVAMSACGRRQSGDGLTAETRLAESVTSDVVTVPSELNVNTEELREETCQSSDDIGTCDDIG